MSGRQSMSSIGIALQPGLPQLLEHAFDSFAFYRRRFNEAGVSPDQDPDVILRSLRPLDETELPELYAEAVARNRANHFLTDQTSGTTGAVKVRYSSALDDEAEADLCRDFFSGVGLGRTDCVLSLDIDSADLYLFYGDVLRTLGVESVFGSVTDEASSSIEVFQRVQPTTILSTPSVLRWVLPLVERRPSVFPQLKRVIFLGEPMATSLRRSFNARGVDVFSFYGATEIGSVAGECFAHAGLHILDGGAALTLRDCSFHAYGVSGRAEWTTCHFRDQPLVKYDTQDRVVVVTDPCICGRSSARIIDVRRQSDAFALHGHTFWHSGFERGLQDVEVEPEFLQMVISGGAMPHLVIKLPEHLKARAYQIDRAVRNRNELGYFVERKLLTYEIEYVSRPLRTGRKARQVIDQRAE